MKSMTRFPFLDPNQPPDLTFLHGGLIATADGPPQLSSGDGFQGTSARQRTSSPNRIQ